MVEPSARGASSCVQPGAFVMARERSQYRRGQHPNSKAALVPGAKAPPPGNVRAMKHGGRAVVAAERRAAPHEAAIFAVLAEDAPIRDADGGLPRADHVIVAKLANVLVRLHDVSAWLDLHGALDERGVPRPAAGYEAALRKEAAGYCGDLGMTPRARFALGLDLARAEREAAAVRDLEAGRRLVADRLATEAAGDA